jgi:hypothetical protein
MLFLKKNDSGYLIIRFFLLEILKKLVVTMRLCPFLGSVKILFSPYLFILCGSMENDPLSPPEGEAAQGEHPLDPLFF